MIKKQLRCKRKRSDRVKKLVSIIYSGEHFYYVLAELVCGLSQKRKAKKSSYLAGSHSHVLKPRQGCSCVHTDILNKKRDPVLCFQLHRENVLLLFVFMCLFKKEEELKIWPIKLDVRQRQRCFLVFKMNRHVATYQRPSCSSKSHSSVRCELSSVRCELSCCDKSLPLNDYPTAAVWSKACGLTGARGLHTIRGMQEWLRFGDNCPVCTHIRARERLKGFS